MSDTGTGLDLYGLFEIDAYEVASLNVSINNFNARNSNTRSCFFPCSISAWEESELGNSMSPMSDTILSSTDPKD